MDDSAVAPDHPSDELLIFVGYSADAKDAAQTIRDIQGSVQDTLNRLNRIAGPSSSFKKVGMFMWESDAVPGPGGQRDLIDPHIERADIALFVFKERIGEVTWQELNKCRDRKNLPVITLFPRTLPSGADMMQRHVVEQWSQLLARRDELTKDWTAEDSRSVLPSPQYDGLEDLKQIALQRITMVVENLLRYTEQTQLPNQTFIDHLTAIVDYDSFAVQSYRKELRDSQRRRLPDSLTDSEFLLRGGFKSVDGRLNRAGVLLFTEDPAKLLPSAKVRCIKYEGKSRDTRRIPHDIYGPLPEQIHNAHSYTLELIGKHDMPVRGSAVSAMLYQYPVVCLREIIANALVHRQYDDHKRMAHIRVFSDRIEVSSPGGWSAGERQLDGTVSLSELKGQSIQRNFRLAHAIAAIRLVEAEGSGIPTALRDCLACSAPEPLVVENEGFIIVTLFPRRNWSTYAQPRLVTKGRLTRRNIFISYSHKDEMWKDKLLSHLAVLGLEGRVEVWDDRRIEAGRDWYEEIEFAILEASVALLLVSADFLSSEFILGEELPRLLERHTKDRLPIIPIIVRPCSWQRIDWLSPIQARPKDGRPLSGLEQHELDFVLSEIGSEVDEFFRQLHLQKGVTQPIVALSNLPTTGQFLIGRANELSRLDLAWSEPNTNVITIVAWGGTGKTALVKHWLGRMAADNHRGAERVFDWSFYIQGNREQATSSDQFIDRSLRFFGDSDPTQGSPYEKGERLARLVSQAKTLLVLDGLEPLQYPPGPMEGRIRDPGLEALIKGLSAYNQGLCIITTRVQVPEIAHLVKSTAPRIDLEHLSPEAGERLLAELGVRGSSRELREASIAFTGHALALILLGTYLAEVHDGDIRHWREVPVLDEGGGDHARRVFQSYQKWLDQGPEWSLLQLMGFFDRPAKAMEIQALLAKPEIKGLTEVLLRLSRAERKQAVARLRRLRLLGESRADNPEGLDAHPLVREYLAKHLQQRLPDAWIEGHRRLYEYHKKNAKHLPDTLDEMMPLYQALGHACQAGLHQEALDQVYWARIDRAGEAFSTRRLGATGTNLAAVSNFFERHWDRLTGNITEADQSYLLNDAGFLLRALGRLSEATEPMRTALEAVRSTEDWENAARQASNLSELYLTLGDIPKSLDFARQGTELAELSGNVLLRLLNRTALADVLHQSGDLVRAESIFRHAEKMQTQRQPSYPLLYSQGGFRYCDLLLGKCERKVLLLAGPQPESKPQRSQAMALCREVQERGDKVLEWRSPSDSLLDIALDHLILGRALLLEAILRNLPPNVLAQADDHLHRAANGLRHTGEQTWITLGLVARAQLRRVQEHFQDSQKDLDEADQIASRGPMPLRQSDILLERTRLHHAQGNLEQAGRTFSRAQSLIEKVGYGRRALELEALRKEVLEGQ